MSQSGVQATVPVSVRVKQQQPWMRRGSGSNIELVCLLTPELLFCYSAIQLRLDQWQSHKLQSVRGHLQLNGNRRCVRHLLMRETEKGISGRLQSEVRGFWLQMRSCFSSCCLRDQHRAAGQRDEAEKRPTSGTQQPFVFIQKPAVTTAHPHPQTPTPPPPTPHSSRLCCQRGNFFIV